MNAPTISICAPAYDEEECIEEVVTSWLDAVDRRGIEAEVVVTDDGSRDRTRQHLESLARRDARVRIVGDAVNRGYGRALREAIAAAEGDFVVTIDSDGQFDPEDIPRLLSRQREGGFDLVTGFRRRKNDTAPRVGADRGLRALVRLLFGLRVRDPNCALKLVRRAWIQSAPLEAEGFPTPTEVMVRAHRDGLKIGEVDVAHLPRAGGRTKLRLVRTALSTGRFLIALRWRR